jgi:hypothetical protein
MAKQSFRSALAPETASHLLAIRTAAFETAFGWAILANAALAAGAAVVAATLPGGKR